MEIHVNTVIKYQQHISVYGFCFHAGQKEKTQWLHIKTTIFNYIYEARDVMRSETSFLANNNVFRNVHPAVSREYLHSAWTNYTYKIRNLDTGTTNLIT
jgi:hypothetical protein